MMATQLAPTRYDAQREKLFRDAGFSSVRTHKLRPGVEASGPSLFAAVAHI